MVAVVGEVGSGKTTLAQGILSLVRAAPSGARSGEAAGAGGEPLLTVGGSTAYVAQKPFVMNDSVRNNIVFHADFDEERYLQAVYACALKPDMEVFVDGDSTEVGEKGVTISGGQKQRLAIARAAFADADVVVFDDPLSAMDAHVGMTVFRRCFQRMMAGKTRIFMTNQLQYVEHCDSVLVLKQGQVVERGTYTELLRDPSSVFHGMMAHQLGEGGAAGAASGGGGAGAEEAEAAGAGQEGGGLEGGGLEERRNMLSDPDEDEFDPTLLRRSLSHSDSDAPPAGGGAGRGAPALLRQSSDGSAPMRLSDLSKSGERAKTGAAAKVLMQKEGKGGGRPQMSYFWQMAKASGSRWLFWFIVLMFLVTPATEWAANYALSQWIAVDHTVGGLRSSWSVLYLGLSMGLALVVLVAVPSYACFFVKASTQLHEGMFYSVLRQKMGWFDTTPVGRILNVFTADMAMLDLMLPKVFAWWQQGMSGILITLVPALVLVPHIIPCLLLLLYLMYTVYRVYGDVTTEMQRLYMMSLGPIVSSFSGYLQGLDTIRAFGRVPHFQTNFGTAIGGFVDVSYWHVTIDCLSQAMVGGPLVSLFFAVPVACALMGLRGEFVPAVSALILYYGSSFSLRMPGALFATVVVERGMVSVDRIIQYQSLAIEPALQEQADQDARRRQQKQQQQPAWRPSAGAVELRGVCMRYGAGLPRVLDGVTLRVEAGSKVGVVGRTGAGKSSLLLAIFRMVALEGGAVSVDGRDIRTLPVRALRSALGMIPQDTFMFSGTMRSNLDVAGVYSDGELWAALEKVNLQGTVKGFEQGLGHAVEEKGSNLSAGTVQLVCMARVLLKQPKLIFMDEATASVDLATDTLVQRTIRQVSSVQVAGSLTGRASLAAPRWPRLTRRASLVTPHVSRLTRHASLAAPHSSRLTRHASLAFQS